MSKRKARSMSTVNPESKATENPELVTGDATEQDSVMANTETESSADPAVPQETKERSDDPATPEQEQTQPPTADAEEAVDDAPVARPAVVLSEDEKAAGYIRPFRKLYIRKATGKASKLSNPMASALALNPAAYAELPDLDTGMVFPASDFAWEDGTSVGD